MDQENQQGEGMTNNSGEHNPKKIHLALFILGLFLVIGSATWLLTRGDDNDTENSSQTTQQTENKQNETERELTLESEYLESYTIDNNESGTMVTVTVDESAGTRTIERNALPNHETGDFPNEGNPNEISEQDFSEEYPLIPSFTGNAQQARTVGIALNGVKFEPDTAERAVCDGSVQHSIEAIQEVTDLGLDVNNAHVQPTGEYHYHGVSDLLVALYDKGQDLVHIGFAADGHLIYYSKSNMYKPSYRLGTDDREGSNCSYTVPGPSGGDVINFGAKKDGSLKSDWEYNESFGDLDECNGTTVEGQYIYLLTDNYPYIGRCLMGDFSEEAPGGDNGGQEPGSSSPPPSGAPSGPPPGGSPPN